MNSRKNLGRIIAIATFYIIISCVFVGRLLYLQVAGRDYYKLSEKQTYKTRTVDVMAQRGEIYDRNGVLLVRNKFTYNVSLDYATLPASQRAVCDILVDVTTIASHAGELDRLTTPKSSLSYDETNGLLSFSYSSEEFVNTSRGKRYKKLIGELNVSADASVDEEAEALMIHFGIITREKDAATKEYITYYNYTPETAARLLVLRLDMELSGFSPAQPYVLAEGVSVAFITGVEEHYSRSLTVTAQSAREYVYPGYASHILGLVGKIPAGKVSYYTERGYALDSVVGISGAEAAFEEYLRGEDGVLTVTEDENGNIISEEMTKEPSVGSDVYLTIDIELQMKAEVALAENIFRIREEANPNVPLTGEDASAGALVAEDVDTGEILALCSYPTYSLATYYKDFSSLNTNETYPLLNRALRAYAPGSTFKISVAVAALSEGTITKDTIIDTKGEYRYYESVNFTPRCWLYLLRGQVHGPITVVEAIQESCNYFFYDVGRRLTIDKMNEYCRHLGLGLPTGIELPESTGILAGPDYRNDNGLDKWSPGDTLQAAIGQSDNLFTPLQIGNYISAVLNHGTRYNAHLLKKVCRYPGGEVIYESASTVADNTPISDETVSTVKEGMRGVMDNGSAAYVFNDYPVAVGGKTGTAQIYTDKSDNSIMIAFAPFDSPELVVTCVIEQGGGGSAAGYAIRDVFDEYFRIGDAE